MTIRTSTKGRKKVTEEEAVLRLRNATNRDIRLVQWGGGASSISTFEDRDIGVTFSQCLSVVLSSLKKTPQIMFGCKPSDAHKKSVQDKYGVDNVSQLKFVKDKKKQTCLDKFGYETNLSDPATKDKIRDTNQARYGHVCSLHGGAPKQKKLKTWEKYEGGHPLTDRALRIRMEKTKISNGQIFLVDGKKISEIASERGLSYSAVQSTFKHGGEDAVKSLTPQQSSLETTMASFLEKLGVPFVSNKRFKDTNIRPDFYLPESELVIECDGLYWHSDVFFPEKNYHVFRKNTYTDRGVRPLFFRSDELIKSPDVCKSIVKNALGLNKRVYARKCQLVEGSAETFFKDNHLMGQGSGRCFYLTHDKEIVAGIQVKAIDKGKNLYEISRFCTVNGTSVVGGFSKLLKRVVHDLNPSSIITFVDLRYGSGSYLASLGFDKKASHVSFKWTNGRDTFHRMKFPGNSGHAEGLSKIWDCGQAKWTLSL